MEKRQKESVSYRKEEKEKRHRLLERREKKDVLFVDAIRLIKKWYCLPIWKGIYYAKAFEMLLIYTSIIFMK